MPDDALAALAAAYGLKDERRTGWELRGVRDPESVAAHSWGVTLLCLVYGPEAGVDVDRALRLATVHDVAEAETGDVPTRGVSESDEPRDERREREALRDLAAPLEGVGDLWEEYEARETPEARFVKDMDLVDLCLQALVYEREGRYDPERAEPDAFAEYDALDEFFATARPRLRTDLGRRLVACIEERYEAARDCSVSGRDRPRS